MSMLQSSFVAIPNVSMSLQLTKNSIGKSFSDQWLNHKTYNTKVKTLPCYRMLAQPILEINCPANDSLIDFQQSYCQQTQDDCSYAETVDLQAFNDQTVNWTFQRNLPEGNASFDQSGKSSSKQSTRIVQVTNICIGCH